MSDQVAPSDRPVIRVAICGEVRAGKSAMLNALLRENLLTDNLGNDLRPTVFAEFDEDTGIQYMDEDLNAHDSPPEVDAEGQPRIESIQVRHAMQDLAAYEFVELPLSTAEELDDGHKALVRSADILIWVTIASQAWRLTEKTIVDELGDARPKRCILAVSRADKFRRKADAEKVMGRMERETADYFDSRVLVTNSRARIEQSAKSEADWQNTGAAEILRQLDRMSGEIYVEIEERRKRPAVVEAAPEAEASDVAEEPEAAIEVQPEPQLEARTDTGLIAAVGPLVDTSGDGTLIGLFNPSTPEDCIVLKGDETACQTVGTSFRAIADKWLTTFGVKGEEARELAFVVHSSSQSLHYRRVNESASVFMMAPCSELSRGTAQVKHTQICAAISGAA
ncbi:hypothetical protein KUV47_14170 [Vannielia litorea]|uniref:hypothetical protein n=1 Tax=Vannielia litorea TaxID=1217970 RepID=UPI001C9856A0|nr:hypothetical protein [Vannielia litorea]MBY6154364.1 hypothetical protein [Vannielia litorea]